MDSMWFPAYWPSVILETRRDSHSKELYQDLHLLEMLFPLLELV